ncbi:hypothetical protein I5G86_gp07 [Mycobacterium phage DarthP]|uniref:Uncharacterized protein n=1 Tax=Mycobacterium phage DarthP TaxID=2015879 RepID=A0A286MRG3_9CAUD|nr:hypothetical protein I5G86_gp07 [Mycobacterium phage DarthP]ASW31838.1 hypothetical protein SEA_DARTHP_92 [Mycobacterium phage DarthP]
MTSTTVTYQGRKFVVETYVDPYPGKAAGERIEYREDCGRCGGSGIYTWYNSMGKCQGSCFGCWGMGKVERSLSVNVARRDARIDAVMREHGDALAAEWQAADEAAAAAELAREVAADHDEALREQARRAALNNNTIGAEGERLRNLDAEVVVSSGFDRDKFNGYGTEYVKLVVFKLADGRVLKATSTGMSLYGLNRGDKVRVTGTVKGSGEYKGQVQTILQRVKVEVVEKAPERD